MLDVGTEVIDPEESTELDGSVVDEVECDAGTVDVNEKLARLLVEVEVEVVSSSSAHSVALAVALPVMLPTLADGTPVQ